MNVLTSREKISESDLSKIPYFWNLNSKKATVYINVLQMLN
jgi:hypothetical protein